MWGLSTERSITSTATSLQPHTHPCHSSPMNHTWPRKCQQEEWETAKCVNSHWQLLLRWEVMTPRIKGGAVWEIQKGTRMHWTVPPQSCLSISRGPPLWTKQAPNRPQHSLRQWVLQCLHYFQLQFANKTAAFPHPFGLEREEYGIC